MTRVTARSLGYFFKLMCVIAIPCFAPSLSYAVEPGFCTTSTGTEILVDTVYEVTDSCNIHGDLRISTNGRLLVNYTNNPENVLSVAGNIFLENDGILYLNGGTLLLSQDYSMHRTITLNDDAIFVIRESELKTNSQNSSANKYTILNAHQNTRMLSFNSTLDSETSWLLGNFYDQSQLIAVQSEYIPTEVYVRDSSEIRVFGDKSTLGVWLDLAEGAGGTMDLPEQTDGVDKIPYSWTVGSGSTGLTGVDWRLEIHHAKVNLGIESHSKSSVTVNGKGVPESGELTVGYYIEDRTETLNGLKVGLQNLVLGGQSPNPPQLTLNNIHLGPVAWQIYAMEGGAAQITNSVINEIGAVNGTLDLQNSDLQLAVVASFGPTGNLTITDSNIHSQSIEAGLGGAIQVQRSNIYGSQLRANHENSSITVEEGEFLLNAPPEESSCSLNNALSPLDGTAVCNPFLPENSLVTRQQSANDLITCDQTMNCNWNP